MAVLVRTDPHATYDDLEAAHPDWIAVDAEGHPRRHWSSPEMWVTCAYGPYNFEFMTAVHKEIMSRYHVDGIFLNRWDGSGQCYCIHCQQNFRAASGFALPRTDDPQDPARRAYILWRQQRLIELLQLWNSELRKINPESCVIPNNTSGALNSLDAVQLSALVPMLVADRQARHGLTSPWAIGKTAKEYRATASNKPVAGLFGVGLEEAYRWKDSVQSPAEIRIWTLDAIANGMRPWLSKFSGTLHDERWLKGVQDIFDWTEKNQRYLQSQTPIAQTALVYSQQSAWFYGGPDARAKVEDYALGWYQALIEARIPFEMVHDRLLDSAHISRFKTLILPNIAALSDAQCDQLRAFVKNGGNLIATYETSLYDEWGTRRKNFGLADLFAVNWAGRGQGPMLNSYLRLEHEAAPHHPLFKGLEDAPRIINGVWRLEVDPRETFSQTPITLIPSYPDLPMEKVYPRQPHTNISGVYLRELSSEGTTSAGKSGGRVAYFPWDIDRTFWEVLCTDHFKLLRNTVEWATNKEQMIQVTGPGLLDVTAWHDQNAIVIHLVNLTNPMTMKGPYREFSPVGGQSLKIRLPQALTAKKVHCLVSEADPHVQHSASELIITVPSVTDHEVVAIDL
jgi:glycosyl hydrolase family 42 (putative beta-galactosidase)